MIPLSQRSNLKMSCFVRPTIQHLKHFQFTLSFENKRYEIIILRRLKTLNICCFWLKKKQLKTNCTIIRALPDYYAVDLLID